jgi:hypothetical protein
MEWLLWILERFSRSRECDAVFDGGVFRERGFFGWGGIPGGTVSGLEKAELQRHLPETRMFGMARTFSAVGWEGRLEPMVVGGQARSEGY